MVRVCNRFASYKNAKRKKEEKTHLEKIATIEIISVVRIGTKFALNKIDEQQAIWVKTAQRDINTGHHQISVRYRKMRTHQTENEQ